MRILLFGSNGQVGRELRAAAGDDLIALTRAEADLAVKGAAADAIARIKPDAIINAAAWTAVDKAESERAAAYRINAEAVGEIAEAAQGVGARLVHLSTDYVFAGDANAPIDETAPTGPVNVYGETKLEGERLLAAHTADAVIIRTSWVYAAHGANFVRTMLRLSEARDELTVVADQIGGPTPASSIARAALKIAAARGGPAGLYHFQGAPAASWADFAEAIFASAKRDVRVGRIATADYPTPARRPLSTVLDCRKIERDFGVTQPDWRADIVETVRKALSD